ncbi:hypothetical protein DES49_1373 [Halospina denitrificans]|uniref:N-acetyltransferase domain-containing protein n=1 Tax=Halospina denitrificans TaxID=332522 RepID=A0A4R7K0Z4_9GAMM|nr:GNAT family N-acetyltransferase [Halospina denitrificans]TDT43553.1 hypothetical protein DES49_1373 [Halospina denitrificans]
MSEIRAAISEDVAPVHSLAEDWVLQDLSPSEAAEKGFLVSNFTPAEYRCFVQVANGFFVLESDGRIEAFILAYTDDRICPNDSVSLSIRDFHPGPFLLIKQICARRGSPLRGSAGRLYEHATRAFPGLAQYAAVVLEPENTRSIHFHEHHGFHKCYEIQAPDGRIRGIWGRD